jgi:AcrR family transcriptional regulator
MARPPRIDRTAVVRAGLALADRDGLEAVTMQAVAASLGVTPMALYRHVDNKAGLLDGLVELLLDEIAAPPESLSWRDQLEWLARSLRSTAQRHPEVFPLLLQRPAVTPKALVARDTVHRLLDAGGIPAAEVARTERVISTVMLGFAASEVGGRFGSRAADQVDDDFRAAERMIELYLDEVAVRRSDPGS